MNGSNSRTVSSEIYTYSIRLIDRFETFGKNNIPKLYAKVSYTRKQGLTIFIYEPMITLKKIFFWLAWG